jgi:hydroxymethylglutaryl-CoA reductase
MVLSRSLAPHIVTRSMASSRIPAFYRLAVAERRRELAGRAGLPGASLAALDGGIDLAVADGMIENVVGTYALPLGVALNFLVDGVDYFVPMAIEEPSVVAAASYAAKMARAGGGFHALVAPPVMIGQVQLLDVPDAAAAVAAIDGEREALLASARALVPRLVARGGGPVGLRVRVLGQDEPGRPMLVVHILVDCCDAMGANLVNTLCEGLADRLAELAGGRVGLRILSNLCDDRLVSVTVRIPDSALCDPDSACGSHDGPAVRAAIVEASRFAELDPYRAATHNKGIMNGVDAVLLATGQDWRGVEAGAHAYACRDGRYRPLAIWRSEGNALVGTLTMPMAVGTVGGALHVHPGARLGLAMLAVDSAAALAAVVAAAGLASNLAALRALATDGIQRGHMALHARVVARAAGATGDLVEQVAAEISRLGDVKTDRAREILERLRASHLTDGYTMELGDFAERAEESNP